jgi:hypothetical protein
MISDELNFRANVLLKFRVWATVSDLHQQQHELQTRFRFPLLAFYGFGYMGTARDALTASLFCATLLPTTTAHEATASVQGLTQHCTIEKPSTRSPFCRDIVGPELRKRQNNSGEGIGWNESDEGMKTVKLKFMASWASSCP